MNIDEALLTRRTAHLWTDEPVPIEVVEKGIQAAQMAPCHRLTWPWRFALAGPETRQKIFELGVRLKSPTGQSPPAPPLLAKLEKKLKNPAHLLIVSQPHADNPAIQHENYAAVSAAIQNLALSIHGAGYATKWSTGGLTTHDETYALAGIDAAHEAIVGFIWVGVPAKAYTAPARPPLSDVFRRLA